jgi:hypothetical protein
VYQEYISEQQQKKEGKTFFLFILSADIEAAAAILQEAGDDGG